jgi:hypothetical protein
MNTPLGGDRIPTKPFRVYWERGPKSALGSFNTLAKAIAFAHSQRLDRRHYIRHGTRIVWPEGYR